MATTPAQKRTPRRRASAPATDVAAPDAPAADAAPALSAAEAPAAKPARKAAAKTAAKTPAKTATKTAAKKASKPAADPTDSVSAVAAPIAAPVEAPAAPARKKAAAKPAAKSAAKPGAKTAAKKAAAAAAVPPTEPAVETALEPAADTAAKAAPATTKKATAKAPAAKKAAAKKAPARKTAAKVAAPEAEAAEQAIAAEPAVSEAPAAAAEAAPQPAPARKRSARKTAAAAQATEAAAESSAAPVVNAAAPAASGEPVAEAEAQTEVEATAAASEDAPEAAAESTPAELTEAADSAEDADGAEDDAPEASAADAEAGSGPSRSRNRRNRRRGRDRHRGERADRPVDAVAAAAPKASPTPAEAPSADRAGADATEFEAEATVGELPNEAPPAQPPAAAPAAPRRPARPAPSGPAHSTLSCVDGDQRLIVWQTGHGASDALYFAAQDRLGADGHLREDDDDSLPRLLRQAGDEGHRVEVDPAVWAQLAARRDARTRAGVLMAAYPDGPASASLAGLLAAPLPLFQAEGALWAVVAGRGLLADERGLGKSVQAIAAAQLWRRHFGLRRIAVISGAGERLAWQRAWRRFAGVEAQVMEGGLHQRQAFWSQAAEVRILAPEALASDAAHLAHWAPELVIVDEPQRLALDAEAWATLDQAPQALVLCGAPLDDQPALLEQLVAWLDRDRLGAFAALREVQAAREGRLVLDDAGVERVSDALSRTVLQRQRAEVAEQLPPLVYSERIVPLAPAQREAHDRLVATLRRSLSGWQASGYLSDTDQWRLATTLRAALAACHRANPAVADSPLAEAVVQAAAEQLQAWAPGVEADAPLQVAVLCETEADAAQLGAALRSRGLDRPGIELLAAGQPASVAPDAVLHLGVPWKARRAALQSAGASSAPVAGQQWLLLVAQDSLESALFDTLAARTDVPRSAADPGSRGFLQGERLLAWLRAVQLALQVMPATAPSVGAAG